MHFLYFILTGALTGFFMALFGIGGGAFIVPAIDAAFLAVPNTTHPPFQLIVIGSLCTIVIASMPRAIQTLKQVQVERFTALILILSALPFIIGSSVVATQLSDRVLRIGFAIIIGLIGLWTFFGKTPSHSQKALKKPPVRKLITVGAISGISSALFGLGGATLLMPLLTMWVSLPIAVCVDISIIFVAATSIISLSSLSLAWAGVHGSNGINSAEIILILILGIVAAITQLFATKRLKRMNDRLRQKLLGIYLISLCAWVMYRVLTS
jgi:uncharacterized protein